MFLVNKKAELLCSLSSLRAPPSSLRIEKHEQLTPNGREPSSLVLMLNLGGFFKERTRTISPSMLYMLSRNAE